MSKVRLGIVGLGNMGGTHARHHMPQLNRCELTAVCDVDPKRLEGFDQVAKFSDSAEMIRSGLIDAILVATPHYDHTTIGIDALNHGLHLLLEKPISVHVADCQRLIGAWEANGKKSVFSAMFNQRTDPHYQAIRRIVQGGELGEMTRVTWIITDWFRTAAYYASGGWRATWAGEGGGVLLNQCPHNLDLLQWITGMPSRVSAVCGFGKYHDIEVEDDVIATLEYPNGATGTFITTTGETPGTNRLEIAGDRGKIVYEGGKITFYRTEESVRNFCDTTPELFPTLKTWKCEIPASGHGAQHVDILKNFLDAILDGKPLLAPAEDGINSVALANAMIWSGLTGRAVDLPLDAAGYEAQLKELIANSKSKKVVKEAVAADMAGTY